MILVAFLFATLGSPFLIIGIRKGVLGRNIELRGHAPFTGRSAVLIGLAMVAFWILMVSLYRFG